jgi:hypothetical protein
VKEVAEIEMCKFELWELYQGQMASILQMQAFKVDENEYRNMVYTDTMFGYFNPLINE